MTITNHALTGALVAVIIGDPVIAIPAAFVSHFVIDIVPHWNYSVPANLRKLAIGLDCLLATLLLVLACSHVNSSQVWLVFAGAAAGVLPDAMWLPEIIEGKEVPRSGSSWLHKVRRFHSGIQWSETKLGIVYELIWLICLVGFIFVLGG